MESQQGRCYIDEREAFHEEVLRDRWRKMFQQQERMLFHSGPPSMIVACNVRTTEIKPRILQGMKHHNPRYHFLVL